LKTSLKGSILTNGKTKIGEAMMEYISAIEAAEKWGITGRMINYYCSEGRIPGAQKIGGTWIIPEDAMKPTDRRKKQGKVLGGCEDGENKNL
jgi:hypothetical protein